MHCPHCRANLKAHAPVTDARRIKILAEHGEMDLDADQFRKLVRNASHHFAQGRKLREALEALESCREIVERLAYDPEFARHVFAYDGQDGRRLFPRAQRVTHAAALKDRFAKGVADENDILRYIELNWLE